MNNKLKPPEIKKNDWIEVFSPASPPFQPSTIQQAKDFFQSYFGLNVKISPHTQDVFRYLAGSDEIRAFEFNRIIQDKNIKMILASRGGYGSIRILNRIKYQEIIKNPKMIMGYSDVTSLLLAVTKMTGLITFYGPMFVPEFGSSADDFTKDFLQNFLFSRTFTDFPLYNTKKEKKKIVFSKGKAAGELIGGCLSLIVSTLGTPYEIDTKGKIFFFEEIGEAPYRIDHFLTHLINAGKIQECSGIIIGHMTDCNPPRYNPGYPMGTFHWEEVIQDRLGSWGIPVMGGFDFGHDDSKSVIPIGCKAEMDTEKESLMLLENPFLTA